MAKKKILGKTKKPKSKKRPAARVPKPKKPTLPPPKVSRSAAKAKWTPNQPLPDDQHEEFAQHLFGQGAKMNITEAYCAAYPKSTRESGSASGCRLLGNVRILQRIQWLKEQAANAKISSIEERKEFLSSIHRTNLSDYLQELPDVGIAISYGPESKNPHAVRKLKQQVRYEERDDGDTQVTIRDTGIELHDPIKAIQELNKMDGAYPTQEKHASALAEMAANGIRFITNVPEEESA